jgi:hypothetical protein
VIHGIWGESWASLGAVASAVARVRRWPSRAVAGVRRGCPNRAAAGVRRGCPNRAAAGVLDQGHRCGISLGVGGFFGEVSER